MLDLISRRKIEALATENLDNIWKKGRNYKWKKEANLASDRLKKSSLASAPKSLTIQTHIKYGHNGP
ncbi:hypothetical protein RND71_026659 [Anisodus tanguticus]|uniref:Uncharacterized protein n=1 Tax=Anisodus tanguticus TaxID=243964 RepID=A0AAE1RMT4_9SOLA|nr:hypothetical protein RND71_026659 [Anisodus tanguticus]